MPATSSHHMVEKAFHRVDARHGTPYPCRQEDLDFIRHHPSRNDGPLVSPRQATLEIVQHNDPRRQLPSYEREAVRRLSNAVHHASRHSWGPDLAIKTFLDLDVVFFGGTLGGYVCVSWKGKDNFADHGESQGRTTECPRRGHALIHLNAEAILLGPSPFIHMFSTVLHEMCVSIIHQAFKKGLFTLWICWLITDSMPSRLCESMLMKGLGTVMVMTQSLGRGFMLWTGEQKSYSDSKQLLTVSLGLATMLEDVAPVIGLVLK